MPDASSSARPLRVVVADSYLVSGQALAVALEARGLRVVGVAGNGRRAVALALEGQPDVVVLDAGMPVMNGLDAAREILRFAPATGVVLLAGFAEDSLVRDALRIGVRGFLVKEQGFDDLLHAIRDVSEGAIYIGRFYSAAVLEVFRRKSGEARDVLTARELDVLRLIGDGKSMKQAGGALGMSPRTAETHRASIMGKLGIGDTAGLVRYAIRRGLIVA
ncbi:MAG TPA: response regulator transcription factor [Gemmatimonadales bacterium]|jgi:DNA-binding NarL/FixJ family response regulator